MCYHKNSREDKMKTLTITDILNSLSIQRGLKNDYKFIAEVRSMIIASQGKHIRRLESEVSVLRGITTGGKIWAKLY